MRNGQLCFLYLLHKVVNTETINEFMQRPAGVIRFIFQCSNGFVLLRTAVLLVIFCSGRPDPKRCLVRTQNLQILRPAIMDASGLVECQLNTRLETLKFITEWLMTPSQKQSILWLYGDAGCPLLPLPFQTTFEILAV
jgi:hypothetical protein